MKRLLAFAFCVALFSCDPVPEEVSMSFSPSSLTLNYPVDKQLTLMVDGKAYDMENNPLGVEYSSNNASVAFVSSTGMLSTVGPGFARITAVCGKSSADFSVFVEGVSYDISINYSQKLTQAMIYSNNNALLDNKSMQSFDVLLDGDIVFGGQTINALEFQRIKPNGSSVEAMYAFYAGHGTNFSVEEPAGGGDQYLWISNFASKISEVDYKGEQLISRIKFEPGKQYMPEDCDNYYFGDYSYVLAAVDTEHDLLALNGGGREFKIVKLSEAVKAPKKSITLRPIKRGGPSGGPITVEETVTLTVFAHDLTSIPTVASFTLPSDAIIQGTSSVDGKIRPEQGFCVYKDRLYFLSGPDMAIAIVDFNGKVIQTAKALAIDDDPEDYLPLGVSRNGYLEPEGIKIRRGKVYVGVIWPFVGESTSTWRSTIIKLN